MSENWLEMVQELWIWDRRTHSRVNSKCKGPEARVCLECCRSSKEPGMTRVERGKRRVVDGIRATLSGDLADDYEDFGFHCKELSGEEKQYLTE